MMCSKIGFDRMSEYLPTFDKFHSAVSKRLMFLKLYNQEVSCKMKFTKQELKQCKNTSLYEMFLNKIEKNLRVSIYHNSNLVKVDVKLTNKINNFVKSVSEHNSNFNHKFSLLNSLEDRDVDTAIKLIEILEKSDNSIFLDGDKIFKNFVVNKILRSSEEREVYVNSDSIDIKTKEFLNTKIFTFWQFLNSNNLDIKEHVKKAIECIKTSEFNQVYLVYPKNENFCKHIEIKSDELKAGEYMIKLIPYSMRSTLR